MMNPGPLRVTRKRLTPTSLGNQNSRCSRTTWKCFKALPIRKMKLHCLHRNIRDPPSRRQNDLTSLLKSNQGLIQPDKLPRSLLAQNQAATLRNTTITSSKIYNSFKTNWNRKNVHFSKRKLRIQRQTKARTWWTRIFWLSSQTRVKTLPNRLNRESTTSLQISSIMIKISKSTSKIRGLSATTHIRMKALHQMGWAALYIIWISRIPLHKSLLIIILHRFRMLGSSLSASLEMSRCLTSNFCIKPMNHTWSPPVKATALICWALTNRSTISKIMMTLNRGALLNSTHF